MQHHGAPTRLLDWTESPLIGLYFAVQPGSGADGALYQLDPIALNEISHIRHPNPNYIPTFDESTLNSYTPFALASEQSTRLDPIAVIGQRNTQRMQAQLGVFTIMHRDPVPVEDTGTGSHVIKIQIPEARKEEILADLEKLGIGKFQLFPELAILGERLKVE